MAMGQAIRERRERRRSPIDNQRSARTAINWEEGRSKQIALAARVAASATPADQIHAPRGKRNPATIKTGVAVTATIDVVNVPGGGSCEIPGPNGIRRRLRGKQ